MSENNKLVSLVLGMTLGMVAQQASAASMTMRECNTVAEYVNESMSGMKVDQVTTLRGAVCTPGPVLNYFQIIDSSLSKSDVFNALPEIEKGLTTRWCSDPSQRELLFLLKGVTYKYEGEDSVYYGEVLLTKGDC